MGASAYLFYRALPDDHVHSSEPTFSSLFYSNQKNIIVPIFCDDAF